MPEELSPESKLYVKEELEKVRNEFKEGLKDAQSKTTKIFTTVALIVGLLASMGVYGLAKDYMKTTIQTNIKTAIDEKLGEESIAEFEKRKGEVEKNMNEAEGLVEKLEQRRSEVEQKIIMAEGYLEKIINLKKIAHLPIGTIIASMLAPDEFAVAVGNPDVFDANESGWVLADGQKDITNSRYGQLSGKTTTPDLRGVFLRGLNEGRNDGKQDPNDRRAAGDYQPDALQQHYHETNATEWGSGYALAGYADKPKNAPKASVTDVKSLPEEKVNVDVETRPRNVAVYFYIKIN